MDTFVFAVGSKKAMARLQKEMQDLVNILNMFCPPCWCNFRFIVFFFLIQLPTQTSVFVFSIEWVLRRQAEVWGQVWTPRLPGYSEWDGRSHRWGDGQQGDLSNWEVVLSWQNRFSLAHVSLLLLSVDGALYHQSRRQDRVHPFLGPIFWSESYARVSVCLLCLCF